MDGEEPVADASPRPEGSQHEDSQPASPRPDDDVAMDMEEGSAHEDEGGMDEGAEEEG